MAYSGASPKYSQRCNAICTLPFFQGEVVGGAEVESQFSIGIPYKGSAGSGCDVIFKGSFRMHQALVGATKGLAGVNKGLFATTEGLVRTGKAMVAPFKGLFGSNKGLFAPSKGLFGSNKGLFAAKEGLWQPDEPP